MRILELNFERTWRGGERQSIYTLEGFKNAGVDVELLCRKNTPLEQNALSEGFIVHSFKSIFGVVGFLIFKAGRFNVLHAQTSQILTYCVFTRLFHQARVFYTRRVAFLQTGFMTKLKYKLTDKIIAISTAVQKNLESFTGRNDISVIPDAVVKMNIDAGRAMKFKDSLNILPDMNIVATIAVIDTEKDPLTMVEAIRLLSGRRKDFVFLHFGNGPLETELRQKIKEYNLEGVYKLVGFQDNIVDFFSIFNVFVMASIQEGMGSSVLDAFIYKVPVVSTDAGGLADIIHDGRGIMCRTKSPDMLADGIAVLLDQPELREKIINTALNYAETKHSITYITKQYLSLLK